MEGNEEEEQFCEDVDEECKGWDFRQGLVWRSKLACRLVSLESKYGHSRRLCVLWDSD